MNLRTWLFSCLALLASAPAAAATASNVVRTLQISGDEAGAQLAIAGTSAPTFTVFRLSDPARVVVDLAGADVAAVKGPLDGKGPIVGVAVSQFSDDRVAVGRVVVAIAEEARYDVRAVGDSVIVAVTQGAQAAASAPEAKTESAQPVTLASSAAELAAPLASSLPSPAASAEANLVTSRRDEKDVANPGHRLSAVKLTEKDGQLVVRLAADGEIGTFDLIELSDPPRLALDLLGFEKGLKAQKVGSPLLKEVRCGKHDGKVRVVLEGGKGERMPAYEVSRDRTGLTIALGAKVGEAVALAAPKKQEPVAVAAPAPAKKKGKAVSVRDVAFRGDEAQGRVVIGVPPGTEYHVARPDPRTAVLTISGAVLPKRLERSLDTSAFGGPVKMVSSFSAPGQSETVQVVASLDGSSEDKVVFEGGQLSWEFASGAKAKAATSAEVVIDGQRLDVEEEALLASRASGFSAETPAYAAAGTARRPKYTGRRVSFEFKEIDIHNLLRIIAEVSKRNVVVSDDVKGKVTIRLRNVPWDQALDIILKSKGLGMEESGSIIRVAPLKDLEEERKVREAIAKAIKNQEPLKVRLIPVNYAVAADISTKVKDLLSERGSMSVDQRTNVIIVKDTLDALARAEGLVRKLDTQTPQVLIESRIVEMNSTMTREVGVQWGGSLAFGPTTGNATGLAFPNVMRLNGSGLDDSNPATAALSSVPWAVNLPAATGIGSGGGLSMLFGSAGGAAMLNLRLTAFESSGQLKTISAPKVTTLDNTPATIGQGYAIPFSQVSANGVNTVFIEAKLELKVTPHVTADGSVLMNIHATNNQPDPSLTGANGQPAISKKEAQTQVLVKDGDTTVIGGIYTRQTAVNDAGVPVLSKIPILGYLFRKKGDVDKRTELLVFITPRIVNRNQMVVANEAAAP
ncbi:MAG: type IV pilus secretin PilQ [Deltaproteobacteria bacterium]|nr:type IV pilus secretin PilQ [Deltaproteobacteria bacterium]